VLGRLLSQQRSLSFSCSGKAASSEFVPCSVLLTVLFCALCCAFLSQMDVDQSCYGFAATSMNFSLMALNALRSGFLTAELRRKVTAAAAAGGARRGQVSPAIAVTAELYGAILHRHYRMWRGGAKNAYLLSCHSTLLKLPSF
jgi:hypothetical protein